MVILKLFCGFVELISGWQEVLLHHDTRDRRLSHNQTSQTGNEGHSPAIREFKLELTRFMFRFQFMIPADNDKMRIMKIFVTRSGMSEMWRVLPDACRAEAKILKSQGIKEHKVPFFFAFKMDGFQFSEFKSPIKNWSEFCSIWFNFRVWYADALLTAGLLFNGKRIPGPIADPFKMEIENYHAGLFPCDRYFISVHSDAL
ncbi:hypothetical protein B9Z55_007845 [Caenorhabditis nigoni]|uniref:Uncharacterized protein n=1 Tax=Caenorhabditis nigoni TaxID=1611254 RepID=A0A2G5VBL0_9PELO|nr:hypothetical protein B9Z55_007845 [Caenorhabditis nigoni]